MNRPIHEDAVLLRQAVKALQRNWPQSVDQPPLADVIAHLGYRANVLENHAADIAGTLARTDAEQTATVLEQISDRSSDEDIRGHVRQVAAALRGNGLVILNGPPQQRLIATTSGDD